LKLLTGPEVSFDKKVESNETYESYYFDVKFVDVKLKKQIWPSVKVSADQIYE
jgi:hypothetical protein